MERNQGGGGGTSFQWGRVIVGFTTKLMSLNWLFKSTIGQIEQQILLTRLISIVKYPIEFFNKFDLKTSAKNILTKTLLAKIFLDTILFC